METSDFLREKPGSGGQNHLLAADLKSTAAAGIISADLFPKITSVVWSKKGRNECVM